MPRMDCRIQPGVSTWFQPREPSTHGDAPQRGARTSITTTYKDDVISYVAIARPCFGAHHFSPPKIECHSCSPPNSDRRCITNTKSGHDVHKEQPQLVVDSI